MEKNSLAVAFICIAAVIMSVMAFTQKVGEVFSELVHVEKIDAFLLNTDVIKDEGMRPGEVYQKFVFYRKQKARGILYEVNQKTAFNYHFMRSIWL